jgi:hypothetical protein
MLPVEQSQVHDVEPLDGETPQVVLDAGAKLFGSLRRRPASVGVSFGADLAYEHEVLGVWVERGVDQLVRDIGSVELGGVDVVDAQLDSPAKDGKRGGPVAWWPEHAAAGQLHRAEPNAAHRTSSQQCHPAGSLDLLLG